MYAMDKHDETPDAPDQNEGLVERTREEFLAHVKALSQRGEESQATSKQLGLGIPDEEPAADAMPEDAAIVDTQNPDEAHRLFWSIQRDLMSALPKGSDHKELRDIVYEEKGDYLNRGKLKDASGIRGSDQRAGYLTHLRRALRVVQRWKREGGSAYDIWLEFRTLNTEAGYKPKLKIKGSLDDVLKAAMRDGGSEGDE